METQKVTTKNLSRHLGLMTPFLRAHGNLASHGSPEQEHRPEMDRKDKKEKENEIREMPRGKRIQLILLDPTPK